MDPLVQKIVREGVSSLKVGMLPEQTRKKLLTTAGDKLLHMGKLREAADTYALGGNVEKLRDSAAWLLEQRRHADAATFLVHVGSPEELARLAEECIAAGQVRTARMLYEELGEEQMLRFLDENFSG